MKNRVSICLVILFALSTLLSNAAFAKKEVISLTAEEKEQILKEQIEQTKKFKTSTFTFDTATVEGCDQFKRFLIVSKLDGKEIKLSAKDICFQPDKERYLTIFLTDNVSDNNFIINGKDSSEAFGNVPFEKVLPSDTTWKKMVVDSLKMSVIGAGVIGGLSLLPAETTNWYEENLGWSKNIKKGFHMDEDTIFVNWVTHPYSGAQYFLLARHNGLSRWASFGYSFFMSTFYWELGIEAYFEQPSIQDFFITPILGSLVGVMFEYGIEYIKKNEGKLFGSKFLGGTAVLLMDPINPMIDNSTLAVKFLQEHGARLYFSQFSNRNTYGENDPVNNNEEVENIIGLFLEFKF